MKKFLSLLLCTALSLYSLTAFAENAATEEAPKTDAVITEQAPAPDMKTQVSVTASIADLPFIRESDVTLELLSVEGVSLGTKTLHIAPDTRSLIFTFDVPEYAIGTAFIVRPVDGLYSMQYYGWTYYTGSDIVLPTYHYTDPDGNTVASTDICVTITPYHDKNINIYYNSRYVPAYGARIIDGTAMVPLRTLAMFMGFDTYYDSTYHTQVVSLGDNYMFYNLGTAYTTLFGIDTYAPYPTVMLDDEVYVALRTFADAVGSTLDARDGTTYMDIHMSESTFVKDFYNQIPVNQWGISSRTGYMVWVSLKEYKVRLYQGSQYNWKPILEATCGIGAPGTPTVTGSFEYKYKANRWDYGKYYVGPCLVFYRGYALHSVLLKPNGTEYDGRVGMKLSHGCIRLKKNDINFIANTIPVGTRIYITP